MPSSFSWRCGTCGEVGQSKTYHEWNIVERGKLGDWTLENRMVQYRRVALSIGWSEYVDETRSPPRHVHICPQCTKKAAEAH